MKREISGRIDSAGVGSLYDALLRRRHEKNNSWPLSEELYGVPSPCIISSTDDAVFWQPQPFVGENNLNAVERAFDIVVQPAVHAFYTTQFAGDMHAQFADEKLTLLQTWSEDDFRRVQENLIGHLVTQSASSYHLRFLLPHKIMSLTSFRCAICPVKCAKKLLGTRKRTVLAASLAEFLTQLKPVL